MKTDQFAVRFIDEAPSVLDEGVLYVSIRYRLVLHLCACGCGNKVKTPISPVGWQVTFDGESISLFPSIGNHAFPCRSHYWVRKSRTVWDRVWSEEKFHLNRAADALFARTHFGQATASTRTALRSAPAEDLQVSVAKPKRERLWQWAQRNWLAIFRR